MGGIIPILGEEGMKSELEVHKNKSYCDSELGKEKAVDTEGGKSGGWKSNLWRSIIQVNELGEAGME